MPTNHTRLPIKNVKENQHLRSPSHLWTTHLCTTFEPKPLTQILFKLWHVQNNVIAAYMYSKTFSKAPALKSCSCSTSKDLEPDLLTSVFPTPSLNPVVLENLAFKYSDRAPNKNRWHLNCLLSTKKHTSVWSSSRNPSFCLLMEHSSRALPSLSTLSPLISSCSKGDPRSQKDVYPLKL